MSRHAVLARLINEHEYKHYVEVGVKTGGMVRSILEQTKCHVTAVDPWKNVPNSGESYDEWDFSAIKNQYLSNIRRYTGRVTTIQDVSLNAVKQVGSCDIVFIDAAHDYENMIQDIPAWLEKTTGIISGHDYDPQFPGVMKAVDELIPNRKLESNAVWWAYAA